MATSIVPSVLAEVYITGEDGDYWYEGRATRVELSQEDYSGIRISVKLDEQEYESVGIYMSPSTARDFVVALGAIIFEAEEPE